MKNEERRRRGVVERSEASILYWRDQLKGLEEELASAKSYNDKDHQTLLLNDIAAVQRKIQHHKDQVRVNKKKLLKMGVRLEA